MIAIPYQVALDAPAQRFLDKLGDKAMLRRIYQALDKLRLLPRPSGCKKMAGTSDAYRIRIGDYRIIYKINDQRLIVTVIRIGNRKDVYR